MSRVEIFMLGEFSIKHGEHTINEKNERSRKKWTMLKYLITFREREIPQDELIELLWAGGGSDRPAGALKTRLHRLRAALSELNLEGGEELFISYPGAYGFNRNLDYYIDAVEFEKLYKQSCVPDLSEKEQLDCCDRAIALYKGDFLHKTSDKWVEPVKAYYRSLYLRLVYRAIDILYKFHKYAEVVDICRKAVLIDNLDHKIHYTLVKALAESGDRRSAKSHYDYVVDLFYNRRGENPPAEFTELYEKVVKTEKDYEADLDAVKSKLNEKTAPKSAFFCEYEFFKYVYRLEIRDSERNKKTAHLCLFNITDKDGNIPVPKVLAKSAEDLCRCIGKSLRTSDIFARYSASQFIIMLPSTSDEISDKVMQRIVRCYKRDHPKSEVSVTYRFGSC